MAVMVQGIEELIKDLESAAEIPDSVVEEMLRAEAEIYVEAQKAKWNSLGLKHPTGELESSITVEGVMQKSRGSRFVHVYPQGDRPNGIRNAEVGFIHEFGAPSRNIPAKNWMKQANEAVSEKAYEAVSKIYDDFLKSKNL
ncbi:MAG: hypothetical protein ACOYBH_07850 [Candidatus Alectryocaccobium sp.]